MSKRFALLLSFLMACTTDPQEKAHPVELLSAGIAETAALPTATAVVELPQEEHLLGQFTTRFKADPKLDGRVQNITLIASKFKDFTLKPGEELSFNQVVGPRTAELGFKNAPTVFMGEIQEGIGGGTCQVSSTLYAAALSIGIFATERRPHSRPSSYIEPGMDATVNYPAECQVDKPDPRICYDLKLKNPYESSLVFRAEVGDAVGDDGKRSLTISIFGTQDVPKVTSVWKVWNSPPFEKRFRRVPYWQDDRRRLKQPGQPGLEGARIFTVTYPDGHVENRKVVSHYQPVPEVWQVGANFDVPSESKGL